MELYEGILTRRSIRRWKEDAVDEALIKDVLKAAMFAPSSHNLKNWEFIVVTDDQKKDLLGDVQPYVKLVKRAPVAVVVCGDPSISKEAEGFWVQNCSAAMQNLLLAIHAKGMGGVWCGVHPMADAEMAVKEILNIPEHLIPLGICAFGFPERESARQPERFDETKIHYNSFEKAE